LTHPDPLASIVVLTFNGERYLAEVLAAVFSQEVAFPYEVIVIDSGSTDRTLEIVRSHPVRLHQIPNREFNHGATRNLGALMANGQFVAYLTQAATPVDTHWLQHLIDSFQIDDRVAAVYGQHIPRPDCDPVTKRDTQEFFSMMGPADEPTVRYIAEGPEGLAAYEQNEGIVAFYSDVNSCLRKSVWEKVPYRPLTYSEDQALGRDLLKAGYWKVYEPRAAVFHSHKYTLLQYFRRQFDEYRGLLASIGYVQQGSLVRVLAGSITGGWFDSRYIFGQPYSPSGKLWWSARGFAMNFSRRFAGYLAAKQERLPEAIARRISLETQLKRRAAPQE